MYWKAQFFVRGPSFRFRSALHTLIALIAESIWLFTARLLSLFLLVKRKVICLVFAIGSFIILVTVEALTILVCLVSWQHCDNIWCLVRRCTRLLGLFIAGDQANWWRGFVAMGWGAVALGWGKSWTKSFEYLLSLSYDLLGLQRHYRFGQTLCHKALIKVQQVFSARNQGHKGGLDSLVKQILHIYSCKEGVQ